MLNFSLAPPSVASNALIWSGTIFSTSGFASLIAFSAVIGLREGRKEKLWAAHFAGKEKEYCHIENLANLDKIPRPYGFKVAVFPIKIEHAGGGWVRAVAIIDS